MSAARVAASAARPPAGGGGVGDGLGVVPVGPLERSAARILARTTGAGIVLVAVGLVVLAGSGTISLGAPAPSVPPDLRSFVDALLTGRPDLLIRSGIALIVAAPTLRVLTTLVGYLRAGETGFGILALLVGVVLASGVALGLTRS